MRRLSIIALASRRRRLDFLRAKPRVGKFDSANAGAAPTALDGTDVWIITGGEGRFAGATGSGSCELAGLSLAGIDATSDLNCVLSIALGGASEPVTLRAASISQEIAAGVNQSAPSETEIFVIYRNNTDTTLKGVTVALGATDGVRLSAAPAGQVTAPATATTRWPLPDLAAGEVGRFRLTLRVQSADSNSLSLTPEITADALTAPAYAAPVTLSVVK